MMVGPAVVRKALLAAPPTDAGEDQASWTYANMKTFSNKSLHMIVLKA